MANLELKVELIRRFGSQIRAALALGIHESKISKLVQGHRLPTAKERECFERVIGRDETRRLFEKPGSEDLAH